MFVQRKLDFILKYQVSIWKIKPHKTSVGKMYSCRKCEEEEQKVITFDTHKTLNLEHYWLPVESQKPNSHKKYNEIVRNSYFRSSDPVFVNPPAKFKEMMKIVKIKANSNELFNTKHHSRYKDLNVY